MLPHEDLAGSEAVARKVLQEVASMGIAHAHSSVGPWVTVSMGVASLTPNEKLDSGVLIKGADALLYAAKASGRNRYMVQQGGQNTNFSI